VRFAASVVCCGDAVGAPDQGSASFVGAARHVDRQEQDAVVLPDVLDVLTVGGVGVVVELRLREHPKPAATQRAAWLGEEDRPPIG
jgi:hypothetical protein